MKAVLASNNQHKLEEIRNMLGDKFECIYSLKDLSIDIEIEENGTTFAQNAFIKASTIAKLTQMTAIADDSGLCVDILDGRPGVYSARYAGEPCDDSKNNAKLLRDIAQIENSVGIRNRNARFVSVVALCNPDMSCIYGEGSVEGEIIDQYLGDKGFGYDPIFFCTQLGKTFGQADMFEKNKVSHRAKAIDDLKSQL